MRTTGFLSVCLALLAGLAAGCAGAGESGAGGQLRTVVATELRFAPDQLTVAAGRPVQLKLSNRGAAEHDWVVVALPVTGVADDQGSGHEHEGGGGHADHGHVSGPATVVAHAGAQAESRIWFTPTVPGRYTFFCSLPGHREAGMHGVLIVQ